MKRLKRTTTFGTGILLLCLFILPIVLTSGPGCPLARAQDNPCLMQEATSHAQVALIEQLHSTLSVQEARVMRLVRTDVARQALILEMELTLAVVDVAPSTLQLNAASATLSLDATPPAAPQTLPLEGAWSAAVTGGECAGVPGPVTVAFEGGEMTLTTDMASAAYQQVAPGMYVYEEVTATYAVRSTVTVIDPQRIESYAISQSGGQTFTCLTRLEFTSVAE